MVAENDKLTLSVKMSHDGNYWVARLPDFGLVAAHAHQNVAFTRIIRMIQGQMSHAFSHDPSLSMLVVNGDAALRSRLVHLREAGRPFPLEVIAESGAVFSVPEMAVC